MCIITAFTKVLNKYFRPYEGLKSFIVTINIWSLVSYSYRHILKIGKYNNYLDP